MIKSQSVLFKKQITDTREQTGGGQGGGGWMKKLKGNKMYYFHYKISKSRGCNVQHRKRVNDILNSFVWLQIRLLDVSW